MKLTDFSFKREPVWMLLLSLFPAVLGVAIALIVSFMR
jgi:hypothetical protein